MDGAIMLPVTECFVTKVCQFPNSGDKKLSLRAFQALAMTEKHILFIAVVGI